QARRALRVHPVLLLPNLVPELLVERREISRPRRAPAGLSLVDRFARRDDGRAARQSGRSVPALSLPHDHELHAGLPQGAEPCQGDRRDQEDDGGAAYLTVAPEIRARILDLLETVREDHAVRIP